MPKTALAIFDPAAIPAHIAKMNAELPSNIAPKSTINSLSYEGKVWTIGIEGTKTKLTKRNDDGDEENVQVFTGVILDYNKRRGRSYYEGDYNPNQVSMPVCWSHDGIKPEDAVDEKQNPTCNGCPKSAKGSKTTSFGPVAACSQHRMIAIVPLNKLGQFPPLRLKIAITSDYDKQGATTNQAAGWYAFQQYTDMLTAQGLKHTALIPTRIKFDNTAQYPKLLFAPGSRYLSEEELEVVVPMSESEEVKGLLSATYTPNGSDGTKRALPDSEPETELTAAPVTAAVRPKAPKAPVAAVPDDDDEAPTAMAPAVAPKASKPAPAAVVADPDDDDETPDPEAAAAARRAAKKAQDDAKAAKAAADAAKAAAAQKQASVDADPDGAEDEEETPPAPPKATKANKVPAPKGTPAVAPPAAPAAVGALLQDWDE